LNRVLALCVCRLAFAPTDILQKDFCLKFFPVEKVAKLRFKIIGFKQLDNESLGKAWDRFDGFVNF